MAGERRPPETRDRYRHFLAIATRWMDNDLYGHVNNVVYYSYIDTIVNRYLIDVGGLDVQAGAIVGMAVESGCRYHASVAFPDALEAGLRIGHLGNSSVRYEVGIFRAGADTAAADGHFVHVFVERASQRPVPIPAAIRAAFERIRA